MVAKAKQNGFMYFKVTLVANGHGDDVAYEQSLCMCAPRYVLHTPISALGSITVAKLPHYRPHCQNVVCTYHGAVRLCAHMAATHVFDSKQ